MRASPAGAADAWISEGGTSWTQDYPRADRHWARRSADSRAHLRAQCVGSSPSSPDDLDDFGNVLMVAADGRLETHLDPQILTLREYLLRGGFIYMDDFWGPDEYARLAESMSRVFPDRTVEEIEDTDPIFHAVYDLDDRYQVLGQWSLRGGGRGGMGSAPP